METLERPTDIAQGEVPGIPDSFGRSLLRDIISKANHLRTGIKDDHELGVKVYGPANGGGYEQLWDGPLADLHMQRSPDERSIAVRFKDSAQQEFQQHLLRDGIVLSISALSLLGGSLYIRHRNKK